MNYMKQIAEMLGVELGENFKIRFESGDITDDLYMLTPAGICIPALSTTVYDIFPRLFTGQIEIVKLPWRPTDDEMVYFITPEGEVSWAYFKRIPYLLAIYKLGKLYSAEVTAEAHAEEDKAYWDEILKEIEG